MTPNYDATIRMSQCQAFYGQNSSSSEPGGCGLSNQAEVDCPNIEVINSFTEADAGMVFDDTSGWFFDFEGGDFHLSGTHPAAIETAAIWQLGDPTTDIDGEPRPVTDQGPDFAGADLIP